MTAAPMTTAQVADLWGMPRRRIVRWCEKGVFPNAFRVGNRWAIPRADVKLREGDLAQIPT